MRALVKANNQLLEDSTSANEIEAIWCHFAEDYVTRYRSRHWMDLQSKGMQESIALAADTREE